MSIMSDNWIIESAQKFRMIEPFAQTQIRQNVISFGVSSYGYDFRLADEFRLPEKAAGDLIIDPKKTASLTYRDFKSGHFDLPAKEFVIARSLEYFRIPRDILAISSGKSTYSRCGLVVNISPLEPEWEGHLTFSIFNFASLPIRIYANEGIAQLIFLKADNVCQISYKDKQGKYQGQSGISLSRVDDC